MKLREMARVVRSKNAGPRLLTFDVMFTSARTFERGRQSLAKQRSRIASLYDVEESDIRIIDYQPSSAVKIVIPRPVMSGDRRDRDVYGAQQHAPLLELEV